MVTKKIKRPDGSIVEFTFNEYSSEHLKTIYNGHGWYKFLYPSTENFLFKNEKGEVDWITGASQIYSEKFYLLNSYNEKFFTRKEIEKMVKMRSFI